MKASENFAFVENSQTNVSIGTTLYSAMEKACNVNNTPLIEVGACKSLID